jgi:hypothetical protein
MTIPPLVNEWWSWTPQNGPEISLAQPWLTISTFGGSRFGLPTLRGSDYEVAFRAGMQHRQKYPNSRTVSLVMAVSGTDPDTGLPATDDQILAWNNNFQYIRQAMWTRDPLGSVQGMLTRRWYLTQPGQPPAVVAATATGELGGSMDPAMTGRTRADFTTDVVLADPYFYGAAQSVTIAAGATAVLAPLGEGIVGEGYASQVNSFTCLLNGPLTTPTVRNAIAGPNGVQFTYLGTVAPGEVVTVDFLAFTATSSLGPNVAGQVKHAGARFWFCLVPSPDPALPAANPVSLTTLNAVDNGTATLQWNDCYV